MWYDKNKIDQFGKPGGAGREHGSQSQSQSGAKREGKEEEAGFLDRQIPF